MDGRRLARGLGWFSIGMGVAGMAAPRRLARLAGMKGRPAFQRLCGVREMVTGVGLLTSKDQKPWLLGRVAGDLLDLAAVAAFGGRGKGRRLLLTTAAIGGITLLDAACARMLASLEPSTAPGQHPGAEPEAGDDWRPVSGEVRQAEPRQALPPYGHDNPVDINEATLDQLLRIPGLSFSGAEGILWYRRRHGRIHSIHELERLPQLTVEEFLAVREAIQITAASAAEEAHRLEKPDLTTEPGGRGM